MHTLQAENEASDMLTERGYMSLNATEKRIVSESKSASNPRAFIAQRWLCPGHPEVIRALSLSNQELLRLLERDAQIPLPSTTRFLFDEIIW